MTSRIGVIVAPALLFGAAGVSAPAFAQEWNLDARLVGAIGAMDQTSKLVPVDHTPLADARLLVTRTDTLDSGMELNWRLEGRAGRDNRTRPAFAGVLGACPATSSACPRIADGAGFRSVVSPTTGLASGGPLEDADAFAVLEAASLSLSGTWGEAVLGADTGVATRLDARAPTVLNGVSAFSPMLDPTGLVVTRARNDVTGPSAKVTYMSPRWLGLRLGASYTPEANRTGADFDPQASLGHAARADLENVWEGALSFARTFAEQDLQVRAAITYTQAKPGSDLASFSDYQAWGAGLELAREGWTGGVRWLTSNNAWTGKSGYEALEVGLTHKGELWTFGAEVGTAEDRLGDIKGVSWLIGARRKISDSLDIGLAYASGQADLPVLSGSSQSLTNARNNGLILELSVRN